MKSEVILSNVAGRSELRFDSQQIVHLKNGRENKLPGRVLAGDWIADCCIQHADAAGRVAQHEREG